MRKSITRTFIVLALVAAMGFVPKLAFAVGVNGDFENGTNPGTFLTLNAGNAVDIVGWSVDSGSVDYIGTYWAGSNGQRSVDLNGLAPASISQTIVTTPGATYTVAFDLSGNPDSRSDINDPYFSPSNKVVSVSATGALPALYSFDTALMGNSLGSMLWQPQTYSFVAIGNSTTLTFASQIPGAFGPALDNVAITEQVPRTGTVTVTKVVVGNSNYTPANFPLFVGDTAVTSDVAQDFAPGMYSIHETGNPNFFPSFSGDCAATPDTEARLDLVSDFQKKKAALEASLIADPLNPLNEARRDLIDDVDAKIQALLNSLEATATVTAGENIHCIITNTYVEPPQASCPAGTHPILIETKTVDSASFTPTTTTAPLVLGTPYLFKVSGTWTNLPHNVADAEYASTDAWTTHMNGYDIDPYFLGKGEFDLMVNGLFADWGSYNPAHAYAMQYTGTGSPASFVIFDGDSTQAVPTPNQGWYGDNSGSLSVDVYQCVPNFGSLKIIKKTVGGDGVFSFTGAGEGASITTVSGTGEATITDLLPGSYTIAEAAQAGWNITSNTCEGVVVTAGETATCTVTNTKQSSISGMKYNDLNRNGKKDANEPGISGWTFRLINADDIVVATAVTNANGVYTFTNVADGTFKVREKNQKGWKRMSKNPKALVITAGSNIAGVDFGNAQKKKHENEDTQDDCDRDDQRGEYHGNGGKSNYQKNENDDYYKSNRPRGRN